jgi:alpha-D-xyloside xylohydrolase
MKYVPIIDAFISNRPGKGVYPAFEDGMNKDLFMKINNKTTFIGQVWPNDASYPDYFHPATSAWFKSNLDALWNEIPFDGLWEDMNEASNFCNGFCYDSQAALVNNPVKNHLKYTPTGRDLETKSMPLDATHYNGLSQIDTHNYYGTHEVKVTDEWFKSK